MAGAENWTPVPNWEGIYSVSDRGRVRSERRRVWNGAAWYEKPGRILSPGSNSNSEHLFVNLMYDGRREKAYVHRLVLTAFVGPCPEGMEGCHNNGDPRDNRLANLRWDTRSENRFDEVAHGRHQMSIRTHCVNGHPLESPNLDLVKLRKYNRRQCLACCRTAARFYRHPELRPCYKELSDKLYYEKYIVENMEVIGNGSGCVPV